MKTLRYAVKVCNAKKMMLTTSFKEAEIIQSENLSQKEMKNIPFMYNVPHMG